MYTLDGKRTLGIAFPGLIALLDMRHAPSQWRIDFGKCTWDGMWYICFFRLEQLASSIRLISVHVPYCAM